MGGGVIGGVLHQCRACGGGSALSINHQAAPLIDQLKCATTEGIENPVLVRKRSIRGIGERQAGGLGKLCARQAVSRGTVAEAVGAAGNIEKDLVLALGRGESGLVEGGLASARHGDEAAGAGVGDFVECVAVVFVIGNLSGFDDVRTDRIADSSSVGWEDAEFANRDGAGVGEFESQLASGDRGGEGYDEIRDRISSHGATGDGLPRGAVPVFQDETGERRNTGRAGIEVHAADLRGGSEVDVQRVGAYGGGLPHEGARLSIHGVKGKVFGGVGRSDDWALVGEVEGDIGAERVAAGAIRRIERQLADAERAVLTDEPERRGGHGIGEDQVSLDVGVSSHGCTGDCNPSAAVEILDAEGADGERVINTAENVGATHFRRKGEIHTGRVPCPAIALPAVVVSDHTIGHVGSQALAGGRTGGDRLKLGEVEPLRVDDRRNKSGDAQLGIVIAGAGCFEF